MNRALFVALSLIALAVSPLAAGQQRGASLAQQKMCADQAKKVFEEWDAGHHAPDTDPGGVIFIRTSEYVSHYAPRANICYVMTHYVVSQRTGDNSGLIDEMFTVTDAFENREMATYFWTKGYNVARCYVFASGVHPPVKMHNGHPISGAGLQVLRDRDVTPDALLKESKGGSKWASNS